MSKRTDAEWRDLGKRIAQEVLEMTPGWTRHGSYKVWHASGSDGEPTKYLTERTWAAIEHGYEFWQPHKNVAQAMLVLRTLLVKTGRHVEAELHMRPPPGRCRATIQNWVATGGIPARLVRGSYADNEVQAICLAVEKWLDAQKEE